jgi:hypothetical protein
MSAASTKFLSNYEGQRSMELKVTRGDRLSHNQQQKEVLGTKHIFYQIPYGILNYKNCFVPHSSQ